MLPRENEPGDEAMDDT